MTESSFIKHISYDNESQELTIAFHDGKTYTYSSVPKGTASDFMNAPSLGKAYHQYIKRQFPILGDEESQ